jgi:hypothetical protein
MSDKFLNQIISSPKIYLIKWKDAVTEGGGGWVASDEIEKIATSPLPIMNTVGFVLYETDEYICVSDSIGDKESGSITKIPTGMITEWCLLGTPDLGEN